MTVCPQGHQAPDDASYCGVCGEVIAKPVQPSPGWYADPLQPGAHRYWDGTRWTEHSATAPAQPKRAASSARRPLSLKWLVIILGGGAVASFLALVVFVAILQGGSGSGGSDGGVGHSNAYDAGYSEGYSNPIEMQYGCTDYPGDIVIAGPTAESDWKPLFT